MPINAFYYTTLRNAFQCEYSSTVKIQIFVDSQIIKINNRDCKRSLKKGVQIYLWIGQSLFQLRKNPPYLGIGYAFWQVRK